MGRVRWRKTATRFPRRKLRRSWTRTHCPNPETVKRTSLPFQKELERRAFKECRSSRLPISDPAAFTSPQPSASMPAPGGVGGIRGSSSVFKRKSTAPLPAPAAMPSARAAASPMPAAAPRRRSCSPTHRPRRRLSPQTQQRRAPMKKACRRRRRLWGEEPRPIPRMTPL